MWEVAVKKHEEMLIEKGIEKGIGHGMHIEKQLILIDQLTTKFGKSVQAEKRINSIKKVSKLDAALRKILFAKTRTEVMKFLL